MDLLDAPPVILLPKGIVVNTKDVYAEVASHAVLPTEKIWRYWHGKSAACLVRLKASFGLTADSTCAIASVHHDQQEAQGSHGLPIRALLVACLGQ